MNRVVFPLLFILSFSLQSQNQKVDSLQKLMEGYGEIDSVYVDLRLEYMKTKLFLNPTDTTWLAFGEETLKMAEALEYTRGVALAHERIGSVYHNFLSDPQSAMDSYLKSLSLAERHEHLHYIQAAILGNIANIYREQGELKKALTYYKKIPLDTEHRILAVAQIGSVYSDLGMQDSAAHNYRKAIKWSIEDKNPLYEAYSRTNVSLILHRSNEPKEALEHIERALDLIDAHGLEFLRTAAYVNAAMVYLGNSNLDKAESYALNALDLKESLDNLFTQTSIWGTLSDVYEQKKDYQQAFQAHKKYTVLKDSLESEDRKLEISRKEIQFEADKSQALSQAEIERQKTIKNASLMGGGGLLALGGLGMFLYKRRRDALHQKEKAQFQAKVADTELKALRAQLNPHFIFNSLNSINAYIMKNDSEAASDYLKKFAKLMRNTLEHSDRKEILLQEDMDLLKTYFEIEAKRLPGKFDYVFRVDPAIDPENTLVPPLILQPFIENSVWHGMAHKEGRGTITVEAIAQGDTLVYVVDDDGPGRKPNKEGPTHRSMGMEICSNRIDIINARNRTKGAVRLIDKAQGLRVEVQLPINLAF